MKKDIDNYKPRLKVYSLDTDYTFRVPEVTLREICNCARLSMAIRKGLDYALAKYQPETETVKYNYDQKHKWLNIDYNVYNHSIRITNVEPEEWVAYVATMQKNKEKE